MRTLADVLVVLDEMDIDPSELKLSRTAYNYLLEKAKEVIAEEEEKEVE